MSRLLAHVLFTALASWVVAGPAHAENPKISLNLEEVTAVEAAAALSNAARVPLDFPGYQPSIRQSRQYEQLKERASWRWQDVTLARALRELAERYSLSVTRSGQGYHLFPAQAPRAAAAANPVGLIVKEGIRIHPESVSISSQRQLSLQPGGQVSGNSSLQLRMRAEWPEGDAEAFAGFDNVTAKDDLGNLLLGNPVIGLPRGGAPGFPFGLPDEWSGSIILTDPHPRARKLLWVEADLFAHKNKRTSRAEFELPLKEGTARQTDGDVTFELLRVDPPDGTAVARVGVSRVVARVSSPARGQRFFGSGTVRPTLIGVSGRSYGPGGSDSSGTQRDGQFVTDIEWRIRGVDEPLAKLVLQVVDWGEPERLMTVRLTDIPLPPEGVIVPRRRTAAPPRPGSARPIPERPFFESGGGVLVAGAEILGKPAGEGVVSVGLAEKSGAGFGPIRWQDVDAGANGIARLADVKPGAYRVLRVYHPKSAAQAPGEGRWENGEIEVTVTAGQETMLPPLRWVGEAAAIAVKPPARKPAPKAPAKRR